MPSAAITSANSGTYKPPHEREKGPWSDWELAEGADHLEHAEKIKANPKYMEAIHKHAERKAKEHRETAHHIGKLAKAGKISDKAMEKMKGAK